MNPIDEINMLNSQIESINHERDLLFRQLERVKDLNINCSECSGTGYRTLKKKEHPLDDREKEKCPYCNNYKRHKTGGYSF